jgi:hypothetical protein
MRSTIVTVLSLFIASAALAQTEPPDAPKDPPDTGGPPSVYYAHSYYKEHPNMAGLNDRLSVHVQNFSTLLKNANGNCQAIVLFLDGMAIKGLKPQSCSSVHGHVRYLLLRTQQDDAAWHTLLGSPHRYSHPIDVSVGSDSQFSIPSTAFFELEVIPRAGLFAFFMILILALGGFVYVCRATSLIRSGTNPVPRERPYSLSLFQMSFWFFLVIAAYVFMWLITHELDTITDSILALIGIGSATALGATLIDQKKTAPTPDQPGGTSRGFINDVISDPTGISLHRFQMFVWTLVLGVIFIGSVYDNLEMPQFSATLLGLMGISSGTYLGFKVPEKQGSDTPPGATPEPEPVKPTEPPKPVTPPGP